MLLALAAGISPAIAADGQKNFNTRGIGTVVCTDYLESRKSANGPDYILRSWINGYITARNELGDGTYDVAPDWQVHHIAGAVGHICGQDGTLPISTALQIFVRDMDSHKLAKKSGRLEIQDESGRVEIYVETLARIQKKLSEADLYTGSLDGQYGPQTKSAIKAFQESVGLASTGLPDARTRARLLY